MTYVRHTYSIKQFATQLAPGSKGVAAGMWAVIRTTEEAIAFTDTRYQADHILGVMERSGPHSSATSSVVPSEPDQALDRAATK